MKSRKKSDADSFFVFLYFVNIIGLIFALFSSNDVFVLKLAILLALLTFLMMLLIAPRN